MIPWFSLSTFCGLVFLGESFSDPLEIFMVVVREFLGLWKRVSCEWESLPWYMFVSREWAFWRLQWPWKFICNLYPDWVVSLVFERLKTFRILTFQTDIYDTGLFPFSMSLIHPLFDWVWISSSWWWQGWCIRFPSGSGVLSNNVYENLFLGTSWRLKYI